MADEITNALGAKRVAFRERSGDQHVRVIESEGECVLAGEIHVRLIQDNDALLSAAQLLQLCGAVAAAAGGVGCGDESEGCPEVPLPGVSQARKGRNGEIGAQRRRVDGRAVDFSQDRIERVTGSEELDEGLAGTKGGRPARPGLAGFLSGSGLHECSDGHRQQFIRAVAHDDVLGPAAMKPGEFLPQQLGGGIGVEPQPPVYCGPNCRQNPGRRRIGVLIRVEFDEPLDFGLFTGHVRAQPSDERPNESSRVTDPKLRILHSQCETNCR